MIVAVGVIWGAGIMLCGFAILISMENERRSIARAALRAELQRSLDREWCERNTAEAFARWAEEA